uniref:Transmembrane protein n=1 Tax=Trypanosoma vivax (strain Y486) TaxID=1055687 RepID=G0U844_TRYVY|nr:hypothetical protein TVY486_1010960 [Trypanosoma vivax Y486]
MRLSGRCRGRPAPNSQGFCCVEPAGFFLQNWYFVGPRAVPPPFFVFWAARRFVFCRIRRSLPQTDCAPRIFVAQCVPMRSATRAFGCFFFFFLCLEGLCVGLHAPYFIPACRGAVCCKLLAFPVLEAPSNLYIFSFLCFSQGVPLVLLGLIFGLFAFFRILPPYFRAFIRNVSMPVAIHAVNDSRCLFLPNLCRCSINRRGRL